MRAVFALSFAALVLASPVLAQSSMHRVRGTLEKIDASSLTVKTQREGLVTVTLTPDYAVGGVMKASAAHIKPGSFIGVGGRPQADGSIKAIQVFVFPENMRGAGEGHRSWSVLPETTMTNATVADTVTGMNGPELTLKYKDGQQKIVIPADANIITAVPADKAELKAGADVSLNATRGADGTLSSNRVTVAKPGTQLPL